MKLTLLMLLAVLGLLVAAALAACANGAENRVYTVADLRSYLTGGPGSWVGRTVVVRGTAEPCPWWGDAARRRGCADRNLVLMGVGARVGGPLPLERAEPGPLLTWARSLPALVRTLPPLRPLPLFTPMRFRVQLVALPPKQVTISLARFCNGIASGGKAWETNDHLLSACRQAMCFEGRVLDAEAG